MIDFACKRFRLEEVIKCGFGLSKGDQKIMNYLMGNFDDPLTSDDIAKALKLDKSTVQRSVKKLHEKGVLFRTQENKSGGGYMFLYQAKPKGEIRILVMDIVQKWVTTVEKELKNW